MMSYYFPPLWAVHISDSILSPPWWLGGFAVAAALLWWASRRVRDEEIPRIAVLTAAFFVASLIHVRVGGASAHLLLNALVGMILGRRAVLAIASGLFLQALLLQHGGFTTLGVNCCVMSLPALAAAGAFHLMKRVRWGPLAQSGLVGLAALLWSLTLVYSLTLMVANPPWQASLDARVDLELANALTFHPLTMLVILGLCLITVILERRLRHGEEFALGLLIGEFAVLLTVALNCGVLILGSEQNATFAALLLVVFHLPIALIEGTILGFTTAFLVRVKPEMLGVQKCEETIAPQSLPIPSNSRLPTSEVAPLIE